MSDDPAITGETIAEFAASLSLSKAFTETLIKRGPPHGPKVTYIGNVRRILAHHKREWLDHLNANPDRAAAKRRTEKATKASDKALDGPNHISKTRHAAFIAKQQRGKPSKKSLQA